MADFKVQIFTTDIDCESIDHARAGLYPLNIVADVSAEQLAHFSDQEHRDGSRYRIRKSIRDMLIFSVHDVTKDPQLSKLDFVSCRNLLIYRGQRVAVADVAVITLCVEFGWNAAACARDRGEAGTEGRRFGRPQTAVTRNRDEDSAGAFRSSGRVGEWARRHSVSDGADGPVSGAGPRRSQHEYFPDRTGRAARRFDDRLASRRVDGTPERYFGLRVKTEDSVAIANLTVVPVLEDLEGLTPRGLFLVILKENGPAEAKIANEAAVDRPDSLLVPGLNEYVIRLKQELRAKDEYLQTAVGELETSNEELRSAHEEMQSVTEALATVNNGLQAKVADLSRSKNDMKNLLSGTGIGMIFVNHLLRMLRFTPTVSVLINLVETDVGRPVEQIRSNLAMYDHLERRILGKYWTVWFQKSWKWKPRPGSASCCASAPTGHWRTSMKER